MLLGRLAQPLGTCPGSSPDARGAGRLGGDGSSTGGGLVIGMSLVNGPSRAHDLRTRAARDVIPYAPAAVIPPEWLTAHRPTIGGGLRRRAERRAAPVPLRTYGGGGASGPVWQAWVS